MPLAFLGCLAALFAPASAATYTYSPTNSLTDQWTAGTNWSGVPVSNFDTSLIFGPSGNFGASALTNTSTNNFGAPFLLNRLTLRGTGAATTGSPISVTIAGGSLDFRSSSNPFPTINLDANNGAGTSTVSYAVNSAISPTHGLTFAGNGTASFAFGGVISGSNGILKTGASRVLLGANNTYTGDTTINAGTLVVGGTSMTSSFAVANGAVLELNSPTGDRDLLGTTTFSGDGTLRKTGAGGVYWGASVATFALDYGALIDVQEGAVYAGSNANENWTGNFADLNVASGASFVGGEANVRVDALTGSGVISSGSTQPGYQTFTFGVTHGSGTFSGTLVDDPSHVGSFTKTGTGTQILTGANTYTGGTTISRGTLAIGADERLSDVGDVHLYGGTLALGAFNETVRNIDLGYNVEISGSGTLTADSFSIGGPATISASLAGGQLYFGGFSDDTLTLTGMNTNTNTWIIDGTVRVGDGGASGSLGDGPVQNGGVLIFNRTGSSSVGSISGSGSITKLGAGTLTMTGSNTYDGSTTISAGTLVAAAGPFTLGHGSGAVTIDGGTLDIGSYDKYVGPFTLSSGALVGTGNLYAPFYALTDTGTISASLAGGGLTKSGPGTVILTGNNVPSGTTIAEGTLQLGDGGTSGFITETVTNLGNLAFNRSDSFSFDSTIEGHGTVTKLGGGTVTLGADNTYTGATTISTGTLRLGGASESPSFAIAPGAALDLKVAFGSRNNVSATYSGGGTLVKSGGGTLRWDVGAATFALAPGSLIDVQAGSFVGGSNGNEVWTDNRSGLHVASGASFYGVEANVVVDALTGGGTIFSGLDGGGYDKFTFGKADGSGTFSGVLANFSTFAGNYEKTGTGTQILTGTSTHTGTTTINGGKLVVDGSIATSSLTTINNGGTLAGHGTVGPVTINSGGKISPGNSPGTMTTGSETWNGGGSYVWELNNASDAPGAKGVTYDWLNIAGTLDITATSGSQFTIYVTSLTAGNAAGLTPGFVNGTTYHWIIATGTSATNFSADKFAINTSAFFNDPTNQGGFTITQSGGNILLNYTAVPEPSTYALGIAALLGGTILLRRRTFSRR